MFSLKQHISLHEISARLGFNNGCRLSARISFWVSLALLAYYPQHARLDQIPRNCKQLRASLVNISIYWNFIFSFAAHRYLPFFSHSSRFYPTFYFTCFCRFSGSSSPPVPMSGFNTCGTQVGSRSFEPKLAIVEI